MPTILDYLGFENPEAEQLPGRSFAGTLRGEADVGAEQVVVFDEYGPVRMIRDHEWKYVHRYPFGPHELYNVIEDPDEVQNLVADDNCSEIVGRMRGRLDEWFDAYVSPELDGAKLPVTGRGQLDMVRAVREGRESFTK
jgi:arylsulfatase A-like enzyme